MTELQFTVAALAIVAIVAMGGAIRIKTPHGSLEAKPQDQTKRQARSRPKKPRGGRGE